MDHDRSEHGGDLLGRHYEQIRRADAIRVFAENLRGDDLVILGGDVHRLIHHVEPYAPTADDDPPSTREGRWLKMFYQPGDNLGGRVPSGPVPGVLVRARQLIDVVVNQLPENAG